MTDVIKYSYLLYYNLYIFSNTIKFSYFHRNNIDWRELMAIFPSSITAIAMYKVISHTSSAYNPICYKMSNKVLCFVFDG